jgi:hypothetical protein
MNGTIKSNDVSTTTGYDQMKSVKGSDNGKTVTVVFQTPSRDWKSLFASGTFILPSHLSRSSPAAGTPGWTRTRRISPRRAGSRFRATCRARA